ncbi:MAG: efflux RND transporter permease subunit, partial [Candidatus Eremiobacteraeota bacterium]|nr:efflux RND transporter permease subunit [Candidatus Eremiobacteraeota bacterium]
LPMAFVRGLMGPYMLPIPLGASAAMLFSMVVAFTVVPWAALRLLNDASHHEAHEDDLLTRIYRRMMGPLIAKASYRWMFILGILGLLLAAMAMVPLRLVVFKMLPFDNKSEFQVLIDTPEGTSLEDTAAVARALAAEVEKVPEVTNYQVYVGTSSPYNFNGLVRRYFLRRGTNVADIQVNLAGKHHRHRQSHDIAKALRPTLAKVAHQRGAVVQVAEIPPGPPVLQTLVTEVYGPDAKGTRELADGIRQLYVDTEGVVDVDWYQEDPYPELVLEVDREKAARSGVAPAEIQAAVKALLDGQVAGLFHDPVAREDVPIVIRFSRQARASQRHLAALQLPTRAGTTVALGELVSFKERQGEFSIYHKNLQPVIYVTGDVSGKLDSPLYSILDLSRGINKLPTPDGAKIRTFLFSQPPDTESYAIKWDGEWQVTYEVFRDLGIAFAVVLVLIYALIVGWFQNFVTPLVILSAIPFSMVGIMPGHFLLGAFFTATSMIGFIAGAGIVVRNSIILVDFIELRLSQGMPLEEAVIDAGAVRFRPMLLTAAAVVVGSGVILADPIFNGLAISLMAGEVASLLLSRTAVPVLYYMVWHRHEQHQKGDKA